ncbi:MAG TPA: FGGY family carbohydrate kinase [Rectinemataceae bacterium]|nr:FGGY family carbohydrate kinase [Rectinemataceae bacterium]
MILAFDIGTTAVKASLFDDKLALLASSSIEYELIAERSLHVELDAETYWKGIVHCVKEILAKAPRSAKDIRGIGITTQGETLIPVDASGTALRRAIVWLDGRAVDESATIRALFDEREFYAKTGIPDCNGLCPVSKLLWIKNREPELYANTYKFLLLEDYVIMRLTGKFVSEKSLLSTTGYFDIAQDRLWEEMLRRIGVDQEKIPEALECGTIVSKILPEVAAELGLPFDVLIVTGAMDQTAGALGAVNVAPGLLSETTGTALSIAVTCENPDFWNEKRLTIYRHISKGRYLYIPICMTAGIVLKWFKDEFCADLIAESAAGSESVYDAMGKLAETTPVGANGLVLLPYFAGVTQPDNNPAARGVFLGVGLDTKRGHFIRAIFESIAFMLRENIELIESITGVRVAELRSLGGGAKSAIWSQIKADVTNRKISTMAESECASLGAAILVAVALGSYASAASAATEANEVHSSFEPEARNSAVYEKSYLTYKTLYARVRDLF